MVTQIPSLNGWGGRVALCCVLTCCLAAHLQGKRLPGGVPAGTAGEFVRLVGETGLVESYPGAPMCTKPYSRDVLNKVIACAGDPKQHVAVRASCMHLICQLILYSDIPVEDIKDLILPAVKDVGGDPGEGAEKDYWTRALPENSLRCSWNAGYAIALAEGNKEEVARLEKEGLSRVLTPGYTGDLMAWFLKGKPDEAIAKLTKLKEVIGKEQPPRLDWSLEKAKAQLELNKLKTEAEKRSRLIAIARDEAKSLALRGWAIRKLSDYPGKETTDFLQRILESSHDAQRFYLGFEAQEALKRLKVFPEGVHRYTPVD